MKKDALLTESTRFRGPIARGIAEDAVVRDGGRYGAGLIRGAAVITRGEAMGHGLWIDQTMLSQVAAAINGGKGASGQGVKVRFTHPGMSGDGLGKFLGRPGNATLDADGVVRADLHIAETAHDTPDGDLAKYVMDLAETDAAAFGLSISFERDYDAEKAFKTDKGERSPDADNTKNLRHARLARLYAIDAVDSPAANPKGLFTREPEIVREAEGLLDYALNLTDEAPELVTLGVEADRGAAFVRRFLGNRGLEIVPKKENTNMAGDTKTTPPPVDDATTGASADHSGGRGGGGAVTALAEPPAPRPASEAELKAAKTEALAAERTRCREIKELAADDIPQALVDKAIDEGWSTDRVKGEFLTASRESRGRATRADVVHENIDDWRRVASDAIMLHFGGLENGLLDCDKRAAEAGRFRGMGLQDLARQCVQFAGGRIPHNPDTLLTAAVSGGTFPLILGDTVNRRLLSAYAAVPSIFLQIADPRDVKDFRTETEITMGGFGGLQDIHAGGRIAHGALGESGETYSLDTKGLMFTLTRKQWINDNLGAFMRIPTELGQAAAREFDVLGMAMLVSASGLGPTMGEDATALFDASRADGANYATGAGTVLADAGLATAKKMLMDVKHGDRYLQPMWRYLLVPTTLKNTADKLMTSTELYPAVAGTTDVNQDRPSANPHKGMAQVLADPRLDGTSATAWYLLADPGQWPVFVAVYLNGQRAPTVEQVAVDSDMLGYGWRVYFDLGVGVVNWRGAVRMAGA